MFLWPLLVQVRVEGQAVQPPFVFLLLLPVVIVVCLAEFTEGGMDSKVLAMLGVLTAINAVMRGLSAGMAGIELVFFLLILGGRVFGAGLRLRARVHLAVRLGAADRRGRPVAAVPDARLGLGRDGRRPAAAPGHRGGGRSRCWWSTASSRPTPSGW